jgi:hypothetical protein
MLLLATCKFPFLTFSVPIKVKTINKLLKLKMTIQTVQKVPQELSIPAGVSRILDNL